MVDRNQQWFNDIIYAISRNLSCIIIISLHNLQSQFRTLSKLVTEKILNNKVPRVDSCGTSNKISSHELFVELILVLCFLFHT